MPPGPRVLRGDVSGRAPFSRHPILSPSYDALGHCKVSPARFGSGAASESLSPSHPQRKGGPERGRHRGRSPPPGLPALLRTVSPSPLSEDARRAGRGRALTTGCSVPLLRARAPPQVIQGATTARHAIAGYRCAMGLETAWRLHLRSAMLDAASASRVCPLPGRLGMIFGCLILF
ncbi:hypothetical protein NDU88_003967 [Pleurodeles waltl]|uniref:Uncharacterized protein n=1 Tax=Pleurodeles waltl TaxID=8319 RepID=A0AAV7NSG0_PLEWA|nr:hypothetical protein NDU88_003967 [Pleurodeles waltl]